MEENPETNQDNQIGETIPQQEFCDFCNNNVQHPDVLSCNHYMSLSQIFYSGYS